MQNNDEDNEEEEVRYTPNSLEEDEYLRRKEERRLRSGVYNAVGKSDEKTREEYNSTQKFRSLKKNLKEMERIRDNIDNAGTARRAGAQVDRMKREMNELMDRYPGLRNELRTSEEDYEDVGCHNMGYGGKRGGGGHKRVGGKQGENASLYHDEAVFNRPGDSVYAAELGYEKYLPPNQWTLARAEQFEESLTTKGDKETKTEVMQIMTGSDPLYVGTDEEGWHTYLPRDALETPVLAGVEAIDTTESAMISIVTAPLTLLGIPTGIPPSLPPSDLPPVFPDLLETPVAVVKSLTEPLVPSTTLVTTTTTSVTKNDGPDGNSQTTTTSDTIRL